MSIEIKDGFLNIPRESLIFRGELSIGDNGEQSKTAPFKMLARSGNPCPWVGNYKLVNDMAGLQIKKPRLTIDWEHGDQELGYANKLWLEKSDLYAAGVIQSINPEDKSAEIIERARGGQPYEASITFDAFEVDELPEGQTIVLNERSVEGPALIVRSWELRGIAICKYGADSNTQTQLNKNETISIKLNRLNMNEEIKPVEITDNIDLTAVEVNVTVEAVVEEEKPTEEIPVAPVEDLNKSVEAGTVEAEIAVETKVETVVQDVIEQEKVNQDIPQLEELTQLKRQFGEMQTAHSEELTSLRNENAELKLKLSQISNFGSTPVVASIEASEVDESAKRYNELKLKAGETIAKIASKIRIPKR